MHKIVSLLIHIIKISPYLCSILTPKIHTYRDKHAWNARVQRGIPYMEKAFIRRFVLDH